MAIRALAKTAPTVSLTIFGDGARRDFLESLVDKLDLKERVFFKGWLPHSEYPQRMKDFRGFIFPTLAEANGIVMQEAMAVGLPVITLRWEGPSHLASDEQAIFVPVESEDQVIEKLAAEMIDLSNDPDRANRIAWAARKKVKESFSWDKVAHSWSKAYATL